MPIVSQMNQIKVVDRPSLQLAKSGPMRCVLNLERLRMIICLTVSLSSFTSSGWPKDRSGIVLDVAGGPRTTNRIQDIFGQPRRAFVEVSDTVHDSNSLSLTSLGQQELGRFEQMEEEKSADEHDHGECAHGQNQIPPAPFIGVVDNESPCN